MGLRGSLQFFWNVIVLDTVVLGAIKTVAGFESVVLAGFCVDLGAMIGQRLYTEKLSKRRAIGRKTGANSSP